MFSSPLIIRTSYRLEDAKSEMPERSLRDAADRGVLLTESAGSVWVLYPSDDLPR